MDYGSLGNTTWSIRLSFFLHFFVFSFIYSLNSFFWIWPLGLYRFTESRIGCIALAISSPVFILYILCILSCNGASCMYFIYVTYILYIQDVLTGVYMLYNLSCITSISLVFLYNHALFLMFYVFAAFVFVWWP